MLTGKYKGFRATFAPDDVYYKECLVFHQGNAKPHAAAITIALIYSRRVQVLN